MDNGNRTKLPITNIGKLSIGTLRGVVSTITCFIHLYNMGGYLLDEHALNGHVCGVFISLFIYTNSTSIDRYYTHRISTTK